MDAATHDLISDIDREVQRLNARIREATERARTANDEQALRRLATELRSVQRVVVLDLPGSETREILRLLRDLRIDVETTRARRAEILEEIDLWMSPAYDLRVEAAYQPARLVAEAFDREVRRAPRQARWSPTRPPRRARARGHRPVRARPGGRARGLRARRGGGRGLPGTWTSSLVSDKLPVSDIWKKNQIL